MPPIRNGDLRVKKYFFGTGPGLPHAVTLREGGLTRGLDPRLDLWQFGVGHFCWGRSSPETYQLALALLADATHHDGIALELAVEFGDCVVERWKGLTFTVSEETIMRWVIQQLCAAAFIYEPEDSIDLATCHIRGDHEQ
jgi:hypothetical protein